MPKNQPPIDVEKAKQAIEEEVKKLFAEKAHILEEIKKLMTNIEAEKRKIEEGMKESKGHIPEKPNSNLNRFNKKLKEEKEKLDHVEKIISDKTETKQTKTPGWTTPQATKTTTPEEKPAEDFLRKK